MCQIEVMSLKGIRELTKGLEESAGDVVFPYHAALGRPFFAELLADARVSRWGKARFLFWRSTEAAPHGRVENRSYSCTTC